MRGLKFRAWRNEVNRFRFFDISTGFNTENADVFKSVEQFTGLTDKNGADIYESDVIKDDDGYNRLVTIGAFGVDCEDYDSGDYYTGQIPDTFPWGKFEVIGNIHQHPELLK